MVTKVSTREVKALLDDGAQIVDVLPAELFLEEHLPDAINIPMDDIASARSRLDPNRTTVVYCHDHQCDLSARGAARLETMGFVDVRDYVDSRAAWFAEGLPSEGFVSDGHRAIAYLHTDIPTVMPDDDVSVLDAWVDKWEAVAVVDHDNVVLGLVRLEAAGATANCPIEQVMQPAPPTVRPSIPLPELAQTMDKNGERFLLVTKLDGTLMGLVRRSDIEGAAA